MVPNRTENLAERELALKWNPLLGWRGAKDITRDHQSNRYYYNCSRLNLMDAPEQPVRLETSLTLLGNSREAVLDGLEQVFKISSWLDFPFTVDEVAEYFLPGLNLTGDQLTLLFADRVIDLPFTLRDRYLLTHTSQSIVSRAERRLFSVAKLESASNFTHMLNRLVPWIEMIAVTGSVAYGSSRKWDDIDLFIVTKRDRMWLSLSIALVLVRLGKLLRIRDSHLLSFCLSYVHDDLGFLQESAKSRFAPLFARELLKAQPLVGIRKYKQVLEDNEWIKLVHKVAYISKMSELHEPESSNTGTATHESFSFFLQWADGIAFVFLSGYLKIRSHITNAKLKSEGLEFRVFDPVMNRHSCMYISNLYRWLHQLWDRQRQQSNSVT
jgi:Nucleotidyltransferase domain